MNTWVRASTAVLLIGICSLSNTIGCSTQKNSQSQTSQSTTQSGTQAPLTVDDLVAPIALYPDQLLAQVLTASTNPQEVLDGGNWLIQNQNLKGDALIAAAKKAGFSASVQYLMAFPQVVDNMCQEMEWTRQLGEAFKSDEKAVMDAIQQKREQAQKMGNLKSSPQMTVESKKADNGQQYVAIQPADPKVVYVPQYNPITIYNTQAPAAPAPAAAPTTTTVIHEKEESGVSTGTAVGIGLLSFGVGMAVGAAFHHDYYPYPAWGVGGVYYGGRPYYPPPYHPAYTGYRPATGYHPPSNYHWNQYNRNTNINVNNNYYGKFQNQKQPIQPPANAQGGLGNKNPSGLAGRNASTLPANNRAGANQPNWKGQNTYQGARPANRDQQKPGASMANVSPGTMDRANRGNVTQASNRENLRPSSASTGNRRENASAGTSNMAARSSQPGANRPATSANAGSMNRAGASGGGGSRPAVQPSAQPNPNRGGDRGFAGAGSSPGSRASASPSGQSFGGGDRGGAFGGQSGGADRAASSRGRSSMGGGGGSGGGRRSGGGGRRR